MGEGGMIPPEVGMGSSKASCNPPLGGILPRGREGEMRDSDSDTLRSESGVMPQRGMAAVLERI